MEGLEYLKTIENDSVDLVFTDPPYITSRSTGMDKWVDYVDDRRKSTQKEIRTEAQWHGVKTVSEWKTWCRNRKTYKKWTAHICKDPLSTFKRGDERPSQALREAKRNYLKYGCIYGGKYAVNTDYGKWDSEFTLSQMRQFVNEFYRVLRPGGTCIIFFDIWKITDLKEMLEGGLVDPTEDDHQRHPATGPGRLVLRPGTPRQKEGESDEEFDARKQQLKDEFRPHHKGFQGIRFIEWIKTNPQPLNSSKNYLTNCREIALMGIKGGNGTFNSKYDNALYHFPLQGGKYRIMPTQKSTALCEALIKKHSNEGDMILDPFMGSGTTAVAAYNTNRNIRGCEIREEMYDQMIERIEGELENDTTILYGTRQREAAATV
jgi:DNA modification methylase